MHESLAIVCVFDYKPIAGHGEEIAFLFHNAPLAGFHYTEDEEKLSEQIITYWTNLHVMAILMEQMVIWIGLNIHHILKVFSAF